MARDETITLRTRADLGGALRLQGAYNALNADEQRLVRTNISLAQSYATLQRAQGNTAGAASTLRTTLTSLSAAPARSVLQLNTQIANLENATTRSAGGVRGLGTAFSGLSQAAGAFGVGLGLQQIISFGIESSKSALALRETQNSLRATAGSQERYTQILTIARRQQELYGGTLKENIEGLSGLSITARQSGADLERLIDISQRLNVLSPEQGLQGARIALAEAFSGNITSLNRRFEIPRAALEDLKDESLSASERLAALDKYLSGVGITSEAVAGKVDQSALAFRRLGAEAEEARNRAGGALADFLAPTADAVATGLDRITRGVDGLREALNAIDAEEAGRVAGAQAYNDAIAQGATAEEARAAGQARATQVTQEYFTWTVNATSATRDHGGAVLQYADAQSAAMNPEERRIVQLGLLRDATLGAAAAQRELAAALGAVGTSAAPRAGLERAGGGGASSALGGIGLGKGPDIGSARDALQPTIRRNDAIRDSENALALARAKNSKERIAILQRELGQTNDVVEKNRILAQIEQERQSGARTKADPQAKGLGALDKDTIALAGDERAQLAEVNRQLAEGNLTTHQRNQLLIKQRDLEEKIADQVERQRDAQLDVTAAIIRDRQQRRDEDKRLQTAERVLRNISAANPRAQEFRDRATDARDLILIEREQRQRAIDRQLREAGGAGVDPASLRSLPPTAPGVAPAGVPTTPAAGTSGENGAVTFVLVDSAGAVIAKAVSPYIYTEMMGAVRKARLTQGA